MASIINRDGRWRALVRKHGISKCATFASRSKATKWAEKIEDEIDQIRATGVVTAKGMTVGKLIDRYVTELEPVKRWGRSKASDLARLKRDVGHLKTSTLTSAHITHYFTRRRNEGAGGVTVSSQIGYLRSVLETARSLWHIDVPVQAVDAARSGLAKVGMVAKGQRRDRRVTDAQINALIAYFNKQSTGVPMAEIVRFCLASGMRISEVCRLQWEDLEETRRTILVRDRKHPTDKWGNDCTVPLLNATGLDAYAIAVRQPRTDDRIFPYKSTTVTIYFTRAVAALKLGDLHLHDLRHEAISRLFAAGYRIEQVALVSGHRDWQMLKRYTHVQAEDLHRGAP